MAIPAKQDNYQIAIAQAYELALERSEKALSQLGAAPCGQGRYFLPVLNSVFTIDLMNREISYRTGTGEEQESGPVGIMWQILALHYLCAGPIVSRETHWMAFADFKDIRGYQSVYQGRVVARFCATAGRSLEAFRKSSEKNGGIPILLGDAGYEFRIFPGISLRIAWYAGDGELPNGASILYPDNATEQLPLEDVVVLSEALVSRLQGKGWG